MTLFYTHFNFCRPHGSLKHKDENGIKRKPLHELWIIDRNWRPAGTTEIILS